MEGGFAAFLVIGFRLNEALFELVFSLEMNMYEYKDLRN
jgi:hypothetical protein